MRAVHNVERGQSFCRDGRGAKNVEIQYPEPVEELAEVTEKVEDRSEAGAGGNGEALQRARNALRYEEFVWMVQREARLSTPDAAALVVRATLATLAERLRAEALSVGVEESASESIEELIADLSCRLPERLRQPLVEAPDGVSVSTGKEGSTTDVAEAEFSMTEFCRRVGQRTGVGLAEAERHARAAAITLDAAVSGTVVDRLRSRLPDEYELLFV